MKTLLITGFEPFDKELINPSWEAVKQLDQLEINGVKIVAHQLPCVFQTAITSIKQAIDQTKASWVIAVGQAGGRSDLTIERVGINIDDARIPDNQGNQPIDYPIVENAPAAYFSTLPIKVIVSALREKGIPASVSQTAGTFVCNHVLYGMLHYLAEKHPKTKGGFVHIPYLPKQVINKPNIPSMGIETLLVGLKIIIETSIATKKDKAISDGAIH